MASNPTFTLDFFGVQVLFACLSWAEPMFHLDISRLQASFPRFPFRRNKSTRRRSEPVDLRRIRSAWLRDFSSSRRRARKTSCRKRWPKRRWAAAFLDARLRTRPGGRRRAPKKRPTLMATNGSWEELAGVLWSPPPKEKKWDSGGNQNIALKSGAARENRLRASNNSNCLKHG